MLVIPHYYFREIDIKNNKTYFLYASGHQKSKQTADDVDALLGSLLNLYLC